MRPDGGTRKVIVDRMMSLRHEIAGIQDFSDARAVRKDVREFGQWVTTIAPEDLEIATALEILARAQIVAVLGQHAWDQARMAADESGSDRF
jgi:hypothetical protein